MCASNNRRRRRTWRDEVEEVIAKIAMRAWRETNILPNGKVRKRKKPYTLPEVVDDLVRCLGDHDQRRGEERAKAILLSHDIMQIRFGSEEKGKGK